MKKGECSKMVIACISILLFFLIIQNFYLWTIPKTNNSTQLTIKKSQDEKPKSKSDVKMVPLPSLQSIRAEEISCDRSHDAYDICIINGPTVLDPTASTFFVMNSTRSTPQEPLVEKVRPLARKSQDDRMANIKNVSLIAGPRSPKCEIQHKAPAVVFSAGGYIGNFFHEFNDGFIPLYITINSIFPDQDVILVVSDARDRWIRKFRELLRGFSKHPVINLNNDTATHCFPSASVGMISHGHMVIDPSLLPNAKKLTDFHAFLGKVYGQNQKVQNLPKFRPHLVIAGRSRTDGRRLLNQNEVKLEAEKIGFDVTVIEPTAGTLLRESYALISSSHAMVGIHGSALTNSWFLRSGSVLLQVVPLGAEWVSEVCFEKPGRALGLEYMEYRIKAEESSLIEKYGKDELVIKDPVAFGGPNFTNFLAMDIYLIQQNVKLDMVRFREYLKEAYIKAKKFMDKEG